MVCVLGVDVLEMHPNPGNLENGKGQIPSISDLNDETDTQNAARNGGRFLPSDLLLDI